MPPAKHKTVQNAQNKLFVRQTVTFARSNTFNQSFVMSRHPKGQNFFWAGGRVNSFFSHWCGNRYIRNIAKRGSVNCFGICEFRTISSEVHLFSERNFASPTLPQCPIAELRLRKIFPDFSPIRIRVVFSPELFIFGGKENDIEFHNFPFSEQEKLSVSSF